MNYQIPPVTSSRRIVLVTGFVCLLAVYLSSLLVGAHNQDLPATASPNQLATPVKPADKTRIAARFGQLPLSFELNKGQLDQAVKFTAHGAGYDLFLTANETVLRVQTASTTQKTDKPKDPSHTIAAEQNIREGTVLRLRLLGSSDSPQVDGEDELPGKVNYFIGNDPAKWRRNVPTYRRAHFREVYPGIDVVYYGEQRELEYDFVIAAGASPKLIRFRVDGATQLHLDKSGDLLLGLNHGDVRLHKPVIYQADENGGRREVKGQYVVKGNEVQFKLERFDTTKPLVIDPVLSYSTLLGSSSNDTAFGIAVDAQGSAYVTGTTDGLDFPTTAGSFNSTNHTGAFVTKLNPTGSALVYSSYLSGVGNSSSSGAFGIAVDSAGNAHVTGSTSAPDFPIVNGIKTASSFFKTTDAAGSWNNQNTGLTGSVAAIAVAPSAPNTIYAASLDGFFRSTDGGTSWSRIPTNGLSAFNFTNTIAVDPTNPAVVYVGQFSGLFKTSDGGSTWTFLTATPIGSVAMFSIVFDPVTPSTMYLGTSTGVFKSVNGGGTWTAQNNFGVTSTPPVHALAIDPTAPSTIYAGTFGNGFFKSTNGGDTWTAMNNGMGGSSPTNVNAIVIDPANSATIYVGNGASFVPGGINKSTNGGASWTPLTNGVPDVRINSLVATPTAVYAALASGGIIKTVNGGSNWTDANLGLWNPTVNSLVKHPTDASVLYAGTTANGFSDVFVTKLNAAGSGLLFSTLLGGSNAETGNGIAVDGSGNISVVGQTSSTNFPLVNAVESTVTLTPNCGTGFVTKLNPAVPSYIFSTYLGGGVCDVANGVATDSSGNVYVTGRTSSTDFPTANAIQPAFAGPSFSADAFVSKFTAVGSFVYSTYLGGASDFDVGLAIAADSSGNAYVTGRTNSSNFPTLNALKPTSSPALGDAFITKLNSQGSAFVYSTYFGGSGSDSGNGIAVDSANNVYVTGVSDSLDFPIVAGALRTKSAMFKSIDGAANWSNDNIGFEGASGGPFNGSSVAALAIDPTATSTVYAGAGVGVFKTINGGRTWFTTNNGLPSSGVAALLINPSTPSTLYVAISNLTNETGVYKSIDGGSTWTRRSNGLSGVELASLAIDPVAPDTLYVAMGTCCTPVSRIFKTTDGGDNWVSVGGSPPLSPTALAVDPLNHNNVYVADAATPGAVFKSTDAGATWQSLGSAVTFARSISVSPHTAGVVYAGTDQGILKSVDGGANWTPFTAKAGKIVFDPVSSSTLYWLTNPNDFHPQGLFKSIDNGQTWVAKNNGLNTAQAVTLAIDPSRPSTLYLASTAPSGADAFVTKINAAGNGLIYSTFLGGPVNTDSLATTNAKPNGIALDSAGNAYITGTTLLTNFAVTPDSFQPFNRGFQDAFVSKLTMSHVISGHVLDGSASPVSGAEIVLNDGASLMSVLSESDGSYQFSRLREGGSFTVSASKPHFTMAPVSQTFNNLNSDQVLDFTATATNAPFHTISGQITDNGVPLAAVTVTLSGSQAALRTTDNNGNYSFELADGGNYTVTPSIIGFNFGPPSQTFNNLNANQTANFAALRQSFVVTNTNNHGSGSLREAITNANATVGADTIVFNIPGPGVKVINLQNSLPDITERVVIDGTTQPGYAGTPLVQLDGTALGNFGGSALVIKAGSSTVRGLAIVNFRGAAGISLNGCDNNLITANYLGVAADGITLQRNFRGVLLTNSSNNTIGGTSAAARNVISGNNGGIEIASGAGNVIQGNFIGTNAAGTAAVPNVGGVSISGASTANNLIGGTASGTGNLISGNDFGLQATTTDTTIQGNLIGTDITGTKKIPNTSAGVQAIGTNILIGGLTPAARNVISGNAGDGVLIRGAGSKLQGNFIGTDVTGMLALGNSGNGVIAGDTALIGGTVPEARNIISASGNQGNVVLNANNPNAAVTVQGNYIGTDVTGTRALGGSAPGVNIASNNNVVGGFVAGARNIISGNSIGIQIGSLFSSLWSGNVIQGNFVGVDVTGTGPLPNSQQGIAIVNGTNNTIGGPPSQGANKIAFNGGAGVSVSAGLGNSIRGNFIFSNNGLGIDLAANGVTANDAGDADSGPNALQNFPVITTVMSTSNSTTIQGSLNSLPNTTFQIDFYSNSSVDPSGNGEGAQFFNTTSVNTNGTGDATINVTFPIALTPGRVITATATDPNGNTSEFSAADANAATGSVQFTVSSVQIIEDLGTLVLTVVRSGGVGTVSVDYSTVDGTAIAGQDYTATSGTLTFSPAETSKTIQVPITNDAITEPDETFSVVLHNNANPEAVGAPAAVLVTVQDRNTVPSVSINSLSTVEGNTGSTPLVFTISLSAQTGRSVSGNFATSNLSAFGGATCSTQGVDYESAAGTFSFNPGSTTFTLPITVCGDKNAEANETFRVSLTNPTGATLLFSQGIGTIVNDDILELALEENGPTATEAAAVDSIFAVRDPFRVVGIPDWFPVAVDRNTRVALFVRGLQLNPGELPTAVFVRILASNGLTIDVPAEDVRAIPNTDLTQVIVRLPDGLPTGTTTVSIRAHTRLSNTGTIRITP